MLERLTNAESKALFIISKILSEHLKLPIDSIFPLLRKVVLSNCLDHRCARSVIHRIAVATDLFIADGGKTLEEFMEILVELGVRIPKEVALVVGVPTGTKAEARA